MSPCLRGLTHQKSGYLLVSLCLILLVMSTLVWIMSRAVLAGNLVQTDRRMEDMARECALAGRDLVLRKARLDDESGGPGAWRVKAAAGGYNFVDSELAGGRVATRLTDPSGNFTDRTWETCVLTCTGFVGTAQYTFREVLAPARAAVLSHTIFTGADLDINKTPLVHGSAYANLDIIPANRTFNGDAYAGGLIDVNVLGKKFPNSGTLPVPDVDSSWYMAVGTVIPRQNEYKDKLFSPNSNPFGPPNPYGVYIVAPASGDIKFKNCRIVGTIVYPNANGREVKFERSGTLIESVSPEQLSLLVLGNDATKIKFDWKAEARENAAVNFNPAGSPYPWLGGTTDADIADKYASRLEGGVWCSGEIETKGNFFTMHGTMGSKMRFKFRGHAGWVSADQYFPLRGMEGIGLMPYPGTLVKL